MLHPDRVTGQATRYAQLSGDWHQESASWTCSAAVWVATCPVA